MMKMSVGGPGRKRLFLGMALIPGGTLVVWGLVVGLFVMAEPRGVWPFVTPMFVMAAWNTGQVTGRMPASERSCNVFLGVGGLMGFVWLAVQSPPYFWAAFALFFVHMVGWLLVTKMEDSRESVSDA